MIESKVYKCEVCGTTYASKVDCHECEVFHAKVKEITGEQHKPYKANFGVPYPHQLTVLMDNGQKVIYVYKCPLNVR